MPMMVEASNLQSEYVRKMLGDHEKIAAGSRDSRYEEKKRR